MPFCPLCKTEYRRGFNICTDCGSLLVDSPPEEQYTPPPSLKGKVLNVAGQVVAVVGFSIAVVFPTLVLGKPSVQVWGPWLAISVPCVLLFAFGWFLHDWLSPALVWLSWTVFGITALIIGRSAELPTLGEIAMALVGLPGALAMPVICGIYFGRTKKLYLFFIPLLAYALLIRIM